MEVLLNSTPFLGQLLTTVECSPHALRSPVLLQASSSEALHSLLCHCGCYLIEDCYSYVQSCQNLLQGCNMEVLHNLLLEPHTFTQQYHMSSSLLQASGMEVLQSLLEANERFRGKVQQQHYAEEMLRVSGWLLSRVSVLAHHACASACADCLSVLAGRLPVPDFLSASQS